MSDPTTNRTELETWLAAQIHDCTQPIQTILTANAMIRKQLRDEQQPLDREALTLAADRIQEAAQNLTRLMTGLSRNRGGIGGGERKRMIG